jgi:pyruvate dehydrogenase E2 component (dihydrolipoamide acetyltransferase)
MQDQVKERTRTFKLPDLGEGLQEAEIVAWHVEVGADVVADQPLVSVETDKAVVEVPAPWGGRVAKIHAKPGDVVKIHAPLVDFETSTVSDSGVIVGALPKSDTRYKEEEEVSSGAARSVKIKATPAVRALARKLGVDLAVVDPSGPNDTITAADVQRAADTLSAAGAPEPLRGVRLAMARKMAQSHAEVVPTTVSDEADIECWPKGTDVTVRLIKAMAAACAAAPALNCWYDGNAQTRRLIKRVDLGIAVHTEDGLFVPIMRDVANRSDENLRKGLEAMKRDVQARKIPPEELRGATITLSNFGVFGAGRFAALVIVPPQVAIVGAGIIEPRPVAVGGRIEAHRVMPISLTFDHRAANGGEATAFLKALIDSLEKPE